MNHLDQRDIYLLRRPVKVRRGNDDPLSLLDVDNINLSWQRMSMDENTRDEYRVTYEKGDIVITNGIAAEVEANRHRKKLQIREHRKSEHEILGTFNTSQKQSQTKSPKKQSGSERTRRRSERSETIGSARSSRHRSKKSLLSHRAKALTYDVSFTSRKSTIAFSISDLIPTYSNLQCNLFDYGTPIITSITSMSCSNDVVFSRTNLNLINCATNGTRYINVTAVAEIVYPVSQAEQSI